MRLFDQALTTTRPSVTPEVEREYERMVAELRQMDPTGSRRIGFALQPEPAAGDGAR